MGITFGKTEGKTKKEKRYFFKVVKMLSLENIGDCIPVDNIGECISVITVINYINGRTNRK
jgi:hypothetical protein